MDVDKQHEVELVRFTGIGWEKQRRLLRKLYDVWLPKMIIAEYNSFGGPNIELLQEEGLPIRPFTTTAQSKKLIIDALSLAVERGQGTWLSDKVGLNEMLSYQLVALNNGGFRYEAAPGKHDDTVIARGLSWIPCKRQGNYRVDLI